MNNLFLISILLSSAYALDCNQNICSCNGTDSYQIAIYNGTENSDHMRCYSTCNNKRSDCDDIYCRELFSKCTNMEATTYQNCLNHAAHECDTMRSKGHTLFHKLQEMYCGCGDIKEFIKTSGTTCSAQGSGGRACSISCDSASKAPYPCCINYRYRYDRPLYFCCVCSATPSCTYRMCEQGT